MQTVSRSTFTTVTTEGAILPADLLQRIADGRELEGLRPADYHLAPNERLNEAISRSWNRLLGVWESFEEQREALPEDDRGTTLTRERWLLILFQELGYGRLPFQGSLALDGQEEAGVAYPISHEYDRVPIHLVSLRQPLDRADHDRGESFRRSPHSLVQEFVNRSDRHLWGIVSNGLRLRVLRDNVSFTRAAYLEFDLEAMMAGELYADFSLLWLAVHQSRLEGPPESCWLEKWSQEAAEQGTRALESLRDGVQEAIAILGRGFLAHPANADLRRRLQSGELSTQDYYRQLLRLAYRLIFLFVAEDRNLLLVGSEGVGDKGVGDKGVGSEGVGSRGVSDSPTASLPHSPTPSLPHSPTPSLPHSPTASIRQRYMDYYSVTRLRELAARRRSGPHPDLYRTLRLVMMLLREGYPALGLPALGSYLFSGRSTPDLDGGEIANEALLDAVRALAFTVENRVLRPVDYKNLGAEELGSVYESLLELHPELNVAAATFDLKTAAGSERKKTGSYYTPTSLINSLLDTALEPVVKDRLEAARRKWEEGRKGIGSKGSEAVGSKGVRNERDSVVSGSEGLAGGDESGGDVLPGDAGLSRGGTVRADVADTASGRVGPGEHSGGLRPGEPAGLHSFSANSPGLSEGTGDASDTGHAGEHGEPDGNSASSGGLQDSRRDAAFADSGVGEEGGGGKGTEGIGSKRVGDSLPHSPTPSLPQLLEEALLDIKVVDPAAGSGHFLIAAANRLARHLARIRTGDEEPSPEAAREALRDVVRHCIHGVDINEMAVELCKVGLWLETLDPGKPLNFLEANIQHGDSLIGATPELLEEGIPDAAFTPITGDDKDYCREWKNRNKANRSGQMDLLAVGSQPWQRLGNLAEALSQMEGMDNATLVGVQQQEDAYSRLVRSQDYEYGKLWADAWCAAFVWVKKPESQGGFPYPITEQVFRHLEHSPHSEPQWLKDEIRHLAKQYQFFHWHLAFPHVFRPANPLPPTTDHSFGFDVVLGNPPWEHVELKEKEWFAARSLEIAEAPHKASRTRLINQLKKSDPALYSAYHEALRQAEGESHFARSSGRYPLTARGRINTYPLFAELARQVTSGAGRVGVIVPTGIATDFNTQFYFQDLVDSGALASLYDFENREAIFPGVHRSYKFSLLTLTGSARPAEAADFIFFALDAKDLRDEQKRFTLTPREIAQINPNTRTVPIFRGQRDADLTKAIYRRVPVLIEEGPSPRNPWGVEFRQGLFNMSSDSHLFRTREELEAEGWRLEGNRFVCNVRRDGVTREELYLPLYEAKMIHHFDHRWATFDRDFRDIDAAEKQNPEFIAQARFFVAASEVKAALPSGWSRKWLLGFRNVARTTDVRTGIFSVIPESGVGNSAPVITTTETTNAHFLLACLCSFCFDFVVRQKVGGINFNFYIVQQLPVLAPDTYHQLCPWVADNEAQVTVGEWLLPRVLELTYTAYDLRPFAQDLGYYGPPFRWDEERRFLLRCELDAAYFHLYGIERDDVDYIMDTFPIVRRKDEAAYGEYRTKRVILEMYDEMAEAIRQGSEGIGNEGMSGLPTASLPHSPTPYHTRLDPPPAHPDAAHPWDEDYLGPELPRDQWWQEAEPARPPERRQPSSGTASPRATTAVKEPAPTLELKSPPEPAPSLPDAPAAPLPIPHSLFTPPEGSRGQRLKQVMALGDRVKSNRQDATVIAQLVAALADSDENIRWLAGSALGLLGGSAVVHTLAAFLEQAESPEARQEAIKALQRIVDNPREDEGVREMAAQTADRETD